MSRNNYSTGTQITKTRIQIVMEDGMRLKVNYFPSNARSKGHSEQKAIQK